MSAENGRSQASDVRWVDVDACKKAERYMEIIQVFEHAQNFRMKKRQMPPAPNVYHKETNTTIKMV